MPRSYSTPQTWSAGMKPGATDFNREIRDNFMAAFQPSHVCVYRTSVQTFTPGSTVSVTWQATETDTDTMWSAGSPTRLTVQPGWGGLWHLHANIAFGSAASSASIRLFAALRVNGSTQIARSDMAAFGSTMGQASVPVSRYYRLNPGDYVEVRVFASAQYDEVVSGVDATWFEMVWRGA